MSVEVYNDMGNLTRSSGDAMQVVDVATNVMAFGAFATKTTHVLVQAQGGPLRFRVDGTDPTTSVGLLMEDGVTATWSKEMAVASRWIRDGSTSGKVLAQPMRMK